MNSSQFIVGPIHLLLPNEAANIFSTFYLVVGILLGVVVLGMYVCLEACMKINGLVILPVQVMVLALLANLVNAESK
jgi:hypothetical protein